MTEGQQGRGCNDVRSDRRQRGTRRAQTCVVILCGLCLLVTPGCYQWRATPWIGQETATLNQKVRLHMLTGEVITLRVKRVRPPYVTATDGRRIDIKKVANAEVGTPDGEVVIAIGAALAVSALVALVVGGIYASDQRGESNGFLSGRWGG